MSVKTYLQEQIRLVCLNGSDLFTDEEYDLYMQIIEKGKQLDVLYESDAPEEEREPLLKEKTKLKEKLEKLIRKHEDESRSVRLASVLYGSEHPEGVTWFALKRTRRIAEFCCELSRAMGLKPNEPTLDLIVIKWKDLDEMRQLVVNGFYMPILLDNGSVEKRHYRFYTASSGQLRTDKFVAISDNIWKKIHNRLECGVGWKEINEKGGINSN